MSLFEDLKKLTKHSSIYGIGHILSRGIGFLLLPLYTNYLTTTEYGLVALIYTFIAFVNILFLYGLDSALLRFYALEEDDQGRRKILSTTLTMSLCTSVIFFLGLYFFASPLSGMLLGQPQAGGLLRMAAGILFFDTLATMPYLLLRLEERSKRFVGYRFINILINLGLNIYLVAHLGMGVSGVLLSNLIASGFSLLILLPVLWRKMTLRFFPGVAGELLKFGLPFIASGLASMTMELIDRYMLRGMKGLEVVGIYNAGYKLGLFMLLVVMAFKFAWQPFFLKLGRDEQRARKSFAAVLTYFVLAGGFLLLTVSFFVDQLVRFEMAGLTVFGPEFWSGTRIVPVILLAYVMMGIYLIFLPGIYLKKRTRYVPLFTGLGAAVNVAGNLILIPRWGIMGAAWATFGGYLAMAVTLYIVVQRIFPVSYQYGRLAKLIFVSVLIYLLRQWFGEPTLLRLLLLLICYPLGLFATNFFTAGEKDRIRHLFHLPARS
jgi:O-antigen/teichoic acid export membrane protein